MALAPSSATADAVVCGGVDDFPCSYQIKDLRLQPAPSIFKFQARVSQAKLPIGEGLFERLIVNLKRDNETLCQERFSDVRVLGSVLNLEIGRNMSCELDQVIAENHDLFFQICIGGPENCLRPIALATTPYSVKASFASQAQEAHNADVAGQAHYSHRLTADRELFLTKELGTGYFDFYTHPAAPALYGDDAAYDRYENGGFIQWTPLNEGAPSLHITAKDQGSDQPVPLDQLVLYSNKTDTTGRLNVQSGGAHVIGASDITGNTTIRGMLKVDLPIDGQGPRGAHVTGNSTITGTLSVSQALHVRSQGAHIIDDSTLQGDLRVNNSAGERTHYFESDDGSVLHTGDSDVWGDSHVGGDLQVTGRGAISRDLTVTEHATVHGHLEVNNTAFIDGNFVVRDAANNNNHHLAPDGTFVHRAGGRVHGALHAVDAGGADTVTLDGPTGQVRTTGNLTVGGTTTLKNHTAIYSDDENWSHYFDFDDGDAHHRGHLRVYDNDTVNHYLATDGLAIHQGNLRVRGGAVRLGADDWLAVHRDGNELVINGDNQFGGGVRIVGFNADGLALEGDQNVDNLVVAEDARVDDQLGVGVAPLASHRIVANGSIKTIGAAGRLVLGNRGGNNYIDYDTSGPLLWRRFTSDADFGEAGHSEVMRINDEHDLVLQRDLSALDATVRRTLTVAGLADLNNDLDLAGDAVIRGGGLTMESTGTNNLVINSIDTDGNDLYGEAGIRIVTDGDPSGWYIYMDDDSLNNVGDADALSFRHIAGGESLRLDGTNGNVAAIVGDLIAADGNVEVRGADHYVRSAGYRTHDEQHMLTDEGADLTLNAGDHFDWVRVEKGLWIAGTGANSVHLDGGADEAAVIFETAHAGHNWNIFMDDDTQNHLPEADQLAFEYNGKYPIILDGSDGHVGIRNSAPRWTVEVTGEVAVSGNAARLMLARTGGANFIDFESGNLLHWRKFDIDDADGTESNHVSIMNLNPSNNTLSVVSLVETSSRESKKDIEPVPSGEQARMLDALESMELTRYRYKIDDDGAQKHVGFIAEDVPDEIATEDHKGIRTKALDSYQVGAIQELARLVREQADRIAELEARLDAQE